MNSSPSEQIDFFLLTSSCFDVRGQCELQYWGITPGGPALIRITPHHPVFFINTQSSPPPLPLCDRRSLELSSMAGEPVDGLYFENMTAYRDGRRRLTESGVRTWESDVRPEDRWLMERFASGSMRLDGPASRRGHLTVFENPRVTPSSWRPNLRTMSLDIETGRDGRLYSVAVDVSASGTAEAARTVAVLDPAAPPEGRPLKPADSTRLPGARAVLLPTEADLIRFFIQTVADTDPDVLIGWHVIGFDLDFLERKAAELKIPLAPGRDGGKLRVLHKEGMRSLAEMPGRLVMDGPPFLRGAFHKFSDWRLDTVAYELLGRGKDIAEHGREKVDEIERRFREDKAALAHYNLDDAILVTEIFQKTAVLEQAVTRSLMTGLPPDQMHRSVAAFDRFFLPRFHRKGFVAPNQGDVTASGPSPGAMVFTEGGGLYEDVAVLDFKSLYPTVIRTFRIDPYSLTMADLDPLETPTKHVFSRTHHILPDFLKDLMDRRSQAKEAGDVPLSQAVKILMNSMYGVMGSAGCRFYRSELPAAITGTGRWILQRTSDKLRDWGYKVLYGDTDSVFVKLKTEDKQNPEQAGRRLASDINLHFREIIKRDFAVTSWLEIEFEKRYVRLFLPAMRSGTDGSEGAVKRYAGMMSNGELEIKGMEFVRSDSTPLAREFQYNLYKRYFTGQDIRHWMKDMVVRLRAGEFDDKLIYRRRLKRSASDYKSPPPHVRAAAMLDPDGSKDIREVSYVMTPQGPVPIELGPQEIDYNHYISRQLASVADDVLALEGENFDSISGGRQLDLF